MTHRERLNERHKGDTINFRHGKVDYVAWTGLYDDNRIGEIFISAGKLSSDADIAAKDSAIAASLAIQYGCPPKVLRNALLANANGSPAGPLRHALDILLATPHGVSG